MRPRKAPARCRSPSALGFRSKCRPISTPPRIGPTKYLEGHLSFHFASSTRALTAQAQPLACRERSNVLNERVDLLRLQRVLVSLHLLLHATLLSLYTFEDCL